MTNRSAKDRPGLWLTHRVDATYGSRVFINMNYRNEALRSNRLTMWITPDGYDHDAPGDWRFHAKCGPGATLRDDETIELLAALMVYMAAHGLDPETASYSAIVALAERPQVHVPPEFIEKAKKKIGRRRSVARTERTHTR